MATVSPVNCNSSSEIFENEIISVVKPSLSLCCEQDATQKDRDDIHSNEIYLIRHDHHLLDPRLCGD